MSDDDIRDVLKDHGPELFYDSAGFHPLSNNFMAIWDFGQALSVKYVSDAEPKYTS